MLFKRRKRIAIAVVELNGKISEAMAEGLTYRIRELISDNALQLSALVIRINSSGGALGAAESISEVIFCVKSELGIPVICVVIEQALSAALYIALAADHLIVAPSALLGSVGAIYQAISYGEIADRIGISLRVMSEGKFKADLHPYHIPSAHKPCAGDGVRGALADTNRNFLEWIAKRRPDFPAHTHADELSGLIAGRRAIEIGLAHQTGGLLTAFQHAAQAGGMTSADVIRINHGNGHERGGLLQKLMSALLLKIIGSL